MTAMDDYFSLAAPEKKCNNLKMLEGNLDTCGQIIPSCIVNTSFSINALFLELYSVNKNKESTQICQSGAYTN